MDKRSFIILICMLVLVFSIDVISAQTSETEVEFIISGCVYEGEFVSPNSCSSDGRAFCYATGYLADTITDGGTCTASFSLTKSYCCPSNYYCDTDEGLCVQGTIICDYYNTPEVDCGSDNDCADDCVNTGCWWLDSKCYVPLDKILSCSIYRSEIACSEDTYKLGANGKGSEVCDLEAWLNSPDGKLVDSDSCRCMWNGTDCNLHWNVGDIFSGSGDPKWFECARSMDISDCIEGKQIVNWYAWVNNSYPATYNPATDETQETLEYFGCIPGNETILCGNAAVKLSFFTFSNMILVIALLIVFYVVFFKNKSCNRIKEKAKKRVKKV